MHIASAAAVLALLLLTSCAAKTCADNYFEFRRGDCCLDLNHNQICDADENPATATQAASIEKMKTALDNTTNNSIYGALAETMTKSCYFKSASGQIVNGSIQSPRYFWTSLFGAKCNVQQDCIDYVDKVLLPSAIQEEGLTAANASEARDMFVNHGIICSDTFPAS